MLISASELEQHLHRPEWIVFDCRHDTFDFGRGARVFADGHVPGAHFVLFEEVLAGRKTGVNGRHPLPVAEEFASFLSAHGVTADSMLIAYDDAGNQYASRFWWLARWIGLTRVGVLDGGWPLWTSLGLPISRDMPKRPPAGRVIPRPNSMPFVNVGEVLHGINTGDMLVLDARAEERFRGETEPIDPVKGRIPTARNRFYKANLHTDQTMRSARDLRLEFEALLEGGSPAQVVHQCGSGVTACVNLLVMEHVGLHGSKLYPGSWSEWIADPARPIARG